MKIVRFATDNKTRYGILDGESIQGTEGKPFRSIKPTGQYYKLSKVKLLSPCLPSKIVALGLNYRAHAEESKMPLPNAPLMFLKPSTAVIGPEDNIVYPPSSHRVDYEGELGVVIKKPAWRVSVDDALDYVLGYTCGNDVSARDCQLRLDMQWARGKSFDTFAPLGPCIQTEMDPDNVKICTRLNGTVMQDSNTSDLIFSCRKLVSYLSECMTLLPGTVIMTGTPSGVGFARKPPVFLHPGDVVEIEIEGIGVLRNPVVAEEQRDS